MSWLEPGDGTIRQDAANPHTGKGTEKRLSRAGMEDGLKIQPVTQPEQSPGLNINDMGFFAWLECRVWGNCFGSIDDHVEGLSGCVQVRVRTTKEDIAESM